MVIQEMESWKVVIYPSECPHRQVLEHGRISPKCLEPTNEGGYCCYAYCPLETKLLDIKRGK